MRPDRLRLPDSLFPVQAFFNALSNEDFVRIVSSLSTGVGAVVNEVSCLFPGDLDPTDEPFSGVEFSCGPDEIRLSRPEAAKYLKMAVEAHLLENPPDAEALAGVIRRINGEPSWRK